MPLPRDSVLRLGLRRTIFVPLVFVVAAVSVALFPLLIVFALLGDLLRRRLAFSRAVLVLTVDAVAEASALVLGGLCWLRWLGRWRDPGFVRDTYRLATWWGSTLLGVVVRVYGMRVEEQGLECAAEGPYLLLPRHVSIVDTLLPVSLMARRFGLEPRFVVKRQLELDPVLDVMGHRVPTAFVARHGQDPHGDLQRVASLGEGIDDHDIVVIFPEGTRFTVAKRQHLEHRAAERHDEQLAARVARYSHTLPPHHGGVLALLDAAPGLDVVFLAHAGFEGVVHARDFFGGALIGRELRLAAWRVPAAEIPADRDARVAWLDAQWAKLDDWVGAHAPSSG